MGIKNRLTGRRRAFFTSEEEPVACRNPMCDCRDDVVLVEDGRRYCSFECAIAAYSGIASDCNCEHLDCGPRMAESPALETARM